MDAISEKGDIVGVGGQPLFAAARGRAVRRVDEAGWAGGAPMIVERRVIQEAYGAVWSDWDTACSHTAAVARISFQTTRKQMRL